METLIQELREYCSSLIYHGLRKFIFVNGHKGNSPAVDVVSGKFIMRNDVQIAMVEIWKIANSLAKDIPNQKKYL